RRGRAGLLFALTQDFLGKQTDVDYADNATLFVNHWEGEKFVEHEKLAGIEHGCSRGNGYDATHHDLAEGCLERRGQQTTCRKHPHETFAGIHSEKIDNALTDAPIPEAVERSGHAHVRSQDRKTVPRELVQR